MKPQAKGLGRIDLLTVLVISMLTLASLAAPVRAGDESDEHDVVEDSAFQDRPGKSLPAKTLACNPAGNYCYGLFDELVLWIYYRSDGQVGIQLQPDAIDAVSASGYCTLTVGSVLIPPSSPYADRMINQITVARALGDRFRLQWDPNATGACELSRVYSPY